MNLIPRNNLFDFDHLWDSFRLPFEREETGHGPLSPRVDVTEKKDHYAIKAELPGVDKKDIDVTLENGILSISAQTQQENREEDDDGRVIRQERHYGRFVRSFNVGEGVSEKDIKAKFKDGLLTLKVPRKDEPAPSSRRIEVQ